MSATVTAPGPPRILRSFVAQFGRPHGLLGRLAGRMMARRNAATNRLMVELLDVGPDDRVLDVGCGPGLAVAAAAERAVHGLVAGIDLSPVMIEQAGRRNAVAVRAGRVELRQAPADRIPYPGASFTRACSLNSLQFWPSTEAALRDLHRVLAPGGRLVVGLRLRDDAAGRLSPARGGATAERIRDVVALVETVGFGPVRVTEHEVGGERVALLAARRQMPTPSPSRTGAP